MFHQFLNITAIQIAKLLDKTLPKSSSQPQSSSPPQSRESKKLEYSSIPETIDDSIFNPEDIVIKQLLNLIKIKNIDVFIKIVKKVLEKKPATDCTTSAHTCLDYLSDIEKVINQAIKVCPDKQEELTALNDQLTAYRTAYLTEEGETAYSSAAVSPVRIRK